MPRKTPLPEREIGICERVREVRRDTGLSRVAFCKKLHIKTTAFSNYEHKRAPITYKVGDAICRLFHISQIWLATGKGTMKPNIPIPSPIKEAGGNTYSQMFDDYLRYDIDQTLHEMSSISGLSKEELLRDAGVYGAWPDNFEGSYANLASSWLARRFRKILESLPLILQRSFIDRLNATADKFVNYEAREDIHPASKIKELLVGPEERPRRLTSRELDKLEQIYSIRPGMDNTEDPLVRLLGKVRKALTSRGAKAHLAKLLGVSRQSVTNWTKGQGNPSASVALRLLEWIQAHNEGNQQKSLDDVDAPSRPKTPKKGKQINEIPKSRSGKNSQKKP